MGVGRARKHHRHLPRRVYRRHGAYYFVDRSGRWIRLGATEPEAMRTYALEIADRPAGTMGEVFQRWRRERLSVDRAPRTIEDYSRSLVTLERTFGAMIPAELEARDVVAFRDRRGVSSKVQANHDLAVLSQVCRAACEWGYMQINPCREVRKFKIKGRDRVVTDAELDAWLNWARPLLAAYTEFEYRTGLRQGDILAMRKDGFIKEGIPVKAGKTGRRGHIPWSAGLRECVARIYALPRPRQVSGFYLFCNRRGQPYTSSGFQSIMQKAQRRAIEQGILKERFTSWDIRAKHAQDAKAAGLNPTDQLLHDSERTTRTYLRGRDSVEIQPLAWPR